MKALGGGGENPQPKAPFRIASLRKLAGNTGRLAVATGILNLCNVAFNIIAGRLLGAGEFGGLASMLAIISVLSLPIGGLQLAVTQFVARSDGPVTAIRRVIIRWTWLMTGLSAILSAASPLLARLFHVSIMAIIGTAVWIVPTCIGAVAQGVLTGEQKWGPVAWGLGCNGITRLGAGAVLMGIGMGVFGAIAASVLAASAAAAVLMFGLKDRDIEPVPGSDLTVRIGSFIRSSAALTGFSAFTAADILLARYLLPPRVTGFYAAGSVASRLAMYLPAALSAVTFPVFVRRSSGRGNSAGVLAGTVLLTGAVGSVGAIVLTLFPGPIVRTVFGPQYFPGAAVLEILAWAALGAALIGVLLYYLVAERSVFAYSSWAGCGLLVGAVLILGRDWGTDGIAWCLLGTSIVVLGVSGAASLYSVRLGRISMVPGEGLAVVDD